jgi:hypothetical protein
MKSFSQESLRRNISPAKLLLAQRDSQMPSKISSQLMSNVKIRPYLTHANLDGNSCRFDSAFRRITDYQRLCGDATTAESLSNK